LAEKVHIITYGCQMNKADSADLAGWMEKHGFELHASVDGADILLVNTCSVRQGAEDRAIQMVRSINHNIKGGCPRVIGLCGCVAERKGPALLKELPGISLVIGPGHFYRIPELVRDVLDTGRRKCLVGGEGRFGPKTTRPRVQLCEMVKVVEGCTNYCSYCIVPYVRGPERSRSIKSILDEVKELVSRGAREVSLLGQNIMAFQVEQGRRPGEGIVDILDGLSDIPDCWRVRLVTAHPRDIHPWFIRALSNYPIFCPQFQMPFQSGSNWVLDRMGRGYTREDYLEKLSLIRDTFPGAGLYVDVIVGFPRETEKDFLETLSMLEESRPDRAFIFKYSPRPGSKAAHWEDTVPPEEKQRRFLEAERCHGSIALSSHQSLVGKTRQILCEGRSWKDPSRFTGRTREGQIVVYPERSGDEKCLVSVRLESASRVCLYGCAI